MLLAVRNSRLVLSFALALSFLANISLATNSQKCTAAVAAIKKLKLPDAVLNGVFQNFTVLVKDKFLPDSRMSLPSRLTEKLTSTSKWISEKTAYGTFYVSDDLLSVLFVPETSHTELGKILVPILAETRHINFNVVTTELRPIANDVRFRDEHPKFPSNLARGEKKSQRLNLGEFTMPSQNQGNLAVKSINIELAKYRLRIYLQQQFQSHNILSEPGESTGTTEKDSEHARIAKAIMSDIETSLSGDEREAGNFDFTRRRLGRAFQTPIAEANKIGDFIFSIQLNKILTGAQAHLNDIYNYRVVAISLPVKGPSIRDYVNSKPDSDEFNLDLIAERIANAINH